MGDESPESDDDRDFPPLSKLPRKGRARVYPPEFEGAYQALPSRHRTHAKADAYRAWRARVDDVAEVFQLEAAADAYREECEASGKAGTEYVMQAATFFGPGERWKPYASIEPGSSRGPAYLDPDGGRTDRRASADDPLRMTTAELWEQERRWDQEARER